MIGRGPLRWILPPLVVGVLATGGYLAVRGPARHPAPAPSPSTFTISVRPDSALLVPWIDASPEPRPSTTPFSVRPCRASDLLVGDATPGGVGVHSYAAVVRNVGTVSCRIPGDIAAATPQARSGIPLMTLYVGGQVLQTTPTLGTGQGFDDVVLPPLDHLPDPAPATADLFFDLHCSQQTPTEALIAFPGGGDARVRIPGKPVSGSCSSGGGPFLTGYLIPAPRYIKRMETLAVSGDIRDVETAGPDGRLRYVMRMENFSDSPVSLERCPSYLETFTSTDGSHTFLHEEHLLNCFPLPEIPPHRAVRFEMYLMLSPGLLHHPGIITWQMTFPNGGTIKSSTVVDQP